MARFRNLAGLAGHLLRRFVMVPAVSVVAIWLVIPAGRVPAAVLHAGQASPSIAGTYVPFWQDMLPAPVGCLGPVTAGYALSGPIDQSQIGCAWNTDGIVNGVWLHNGSSVSYSVNVPSGDVDHIVYGIPAGDYLDNVNATVTVDGGTPAPISKDKGPSGATASKDVALWQGDVAAGDQVVTITSTGDSVFFYGLWVQLRPAAIKASLRSSPATIWTGNGDSATSAVTAEFTDGTAPVSGLPVTWSTTAGDLSAASATTDPAGKASVTLTQPADVAPSVTAAVTATDAQDTGVYGAADVTFLPDVISVLPYGGSAGPWQWTASCPFDPVVGGGCATGDPDLGDVQLSGDLWNLGGGSATAGSLSMSVGSAGDLDVQGAFNAAPPGGYDTWVRGYPDASYGINLGHQDTSPPEAPSLQLPVRLDGIPADLIGTTAYSLSAPSALTYDVSYDMWLNPGETVTGRGAGTVEIMVWTSDSGGNSLGELGAPATATVPYSVGGVTNTGVNGWDVYASHIGSAGQTGSTGGTLYFVPKNPLGAGTGQSLSVDLSKVFADAASLLQGSYGWTNFLSTYWLDTIPFGAEFGPGSGGASGTGPASFSLDLSSYCLGLKLKVSAPGC